MDLFKLLNKKQRQTGFPRSAQMSFFLANSFMLNDVPYFAFLKKAQEPFDVIRANIVLLSLISKQSIEKYYFLNRKELMKEHKFDPKALQKETWEKYKDLPHFVNVEETFYLPIFSRVTNRIYMNSLEDLTKSPYKVLLTKFDSAVMDPFDIYGVDLYNSNFTKLVLLKRVDRDAAFLDKDSLSIYFVNKQGRLDVQIALFDKYCRHPNFENLEERALKVVDAYYEDDKEKLINTLVENKFISSRFLCKLKLEEDKINKRRAIK